MDYINLSDLMGPEWRFLEPLSQDARLRWHTVSATPRNRVERMLRRPDLARYRGALEAVRALRRMPEGVLVSHLPTATLPANLLRTWLAPEKPHVAFAFNFTRLPTGRRRALFAHSLPSVDELVVFSRFERGLYADWFGLPESRFRFLPWAMAVPGCAPDAPRPFDGPYLCAVGGEGRDYARLLDAARARPDIRLALVVRPHSLAGLDVPANVCVFVNLPPAATWGLVRASAGMVLPLRDAETANGHITLVGAQLLGVPVAVTRAHGVADYVDGQAAVLMEPADTDAMVAGLGVLHDARDHTRDLARCARARAERANAPAVWVAYFSGLEDRLRAAGERA